MEVYQRNRIHPTAIVAPDAVIGEGTTIGPYSIIGPHVVLGKHNEIAPHVVIEGRVRFGDQNRVFQFASIGAAPQDLKFKGEPSELHIGDRNIIRECVTLQPGTAGGGMVTRIGNQNLFMANSHVGHDSIVGDRCVIANSAALSGHVELGSGIVVGGLSGIHQFVRIGDVAMIGAGAMVSQDIPPFCTAQGDRAKLVGLNKLGLERNGASRDEIMLLRRVYRAVFMREEEGSSGGSIKERVEGARSLVAESQRGQFFLEFLSKVTRGVARHRGGKGGEE